LAVGKYGIAGILTISAQRSGNHGQTIKTTNSTRSNCISRI
jgi:hypothetical protein